MLNGVALIPDIPAPVGAATAIKVTWPRLEGFHRQVVVKLEPDPVANLFLQLGNTLLLTLNVNLDATLTVAVMTTAVLKVAVIAPPAS